MADHQVNMLREYRKGNWTVHETMILITAKKMDEERRMKRSSGNIEGSSNITASSNRPAELRWKWVEDYCWSNGCLRSQNQCNDKWDNLMRDYKKVREYESRLAEKGNDSVDVGVESYWKLERHERKDRNLPTSMLLQIYEALVEVVEKKGIQRFSNVLERPLTSSVHLLQHYQTDPLPTPTLTPPLPLQLPPPPPHCQSFPMLEMCDNSDSDTSEYPEDSPAKRRRKGGDAGATAGTSNEEQDVDDEVGSAISKSATVIAEALQTCEQQEERRHREYVSVQERKLKMEEARNESDREAVTGLVHAINGLASSIFALVTDKSSKTSK